jgi:mannose-1-phosphate guanylyltransferase
MKAMVLAAGLGTRLRPLTDAKPKALVELGGRTLLEITLSRLRSFGVQEVIVNVHHFADLVAAYLRANRGFGMRIEISREDRLLDTGGGLKKAGWFFLEDRDKPFLLHNVDVLSTVDLARMVESHRRQAALATLAVQERESTRQLLFDGNGRLCGRREAAGPGGEAGAAPPRAKALAFSGIHVISPRLLERLSETGAFSIIDSYLRLARAGEAIEAFRADGYYWRDLGRAADLAEAERDLEGSLPG